MPLAPKITKNEDGTYATIDMGHCTYTIKLPTGFRYRFAGLAAVGDMHFDADMLNWVDVQKTRPFSTNGSQQSCCRGFCRSVLVCHQSRPCHGGQQMQDFIFGGICGLVLASFFYVLALTPRRAPRKWFHFAPAPCKICGDPTIPAAAGDDIPSMVFCDACGVYFQLES